MKKVITLFAGTLFEHEKIESLRRELMRNTSLCCACEFDVIRGDECIPTAGAYSRFIANILKHIR
ncbi:MAG: hypothetical protein IJR49_05815 [Treponema sp.]|nr:hypothetical protein [Treponema sp.]